MILTTQRVCPAFLSLVVLASTSSSALAIGCPAPGQLVRDGWVVDYAMLNHDGLEVTGASFEGNLALKSAKIVEWHSDYGASGYVLSLGCNGGGGGFQINPYGTVQVLDLPGSADGIAGFEIVADFRMSNWGSSCNYRYDVHYQFFETGAFRIAAGAYGKGCGTNGTYRPLLRIDLAEAGDANDVVAIWDGPSASWVNQSVESYFTPYAEAGHELAYDPRGFALRIVDQNTGFGHFLEPDRGHLGDPDPFDDPFVYAILHDASEGDAELSVVGVCCNNDHQQGPHNYLDGESILGEDVVIWYVPQLETNASAPFSCWTVSGEPIPETYPCFAGPFFRPTPQIFADGFEIESVGRWSVAIP